SLETVHNPTVMIKDAWMPLTSRDRSGGTIYERSILDVLHAAFDSNSEFIDKFLQLVSTGSVYLSRRDELAEDTTATAFTELSIHSKHATTATASGSDNCGFSGRQHTRTVMKWVGGYDIRG
ncbi:hypothetical protein GGI21_001466, partial [Coemansia aciculifera]